MNPRLGREAILDAALALFAEHGIDGVTLAAINKASGHRNRSATTYHFGSKDELARVLVGDILLDHDARRGPLLDEIEGRGERAPLAEVLAASMRPLIDDLATSDGRLRLRLLARFTGDGRFVEHIRGVMQEAPVLQRSTDLVAAYLGHLPEPVLLERIALATGFGVMACADRAQAIDTGAAQPDSAAFGAHVVVLLEALLTAPAPAAPRAGG